MWLGLNTVMPFCSVSPSTRPLKYCTCIIIMSVNNSSHMAQPGDCLHVFDAIQYATGFPIVCMYGMKR